MRSAPFSLALVLLVCATPVTAWEDDVHFGLTKWLALRAGYHEKVAHLLAIRNVGADEGILDARKLVFWYACISRDEKASEIVKDLHFPSGAGLPKPPSERLVTPGDKWAFHTVNTEVERKVIQEDERQDSLRRFGRGLHPLQDSWSHQGEPGIPIACNEGLAWGHPSKRGGWLRHRADLTAHWKADTLAAAEATWKSLQAYASAKEWVRARAPVDWATLKADIESFGAANTKTAKLDWFLARGFDEAAILRYITRISLPDGSRPLSKMNIPMVNAPAPGPVVSVAAIPADAAAFLQEFWNRWVSARDFPALASRYVAANVLARNLGVQGQPDDIAATTLALWRVADHGQVERLGHVPPVPGSQAESELRLLLKDPASFIVSDGLPYAMTPLGVKGPPLALVPAGGTRYAALGRFWHAPYDVVMAVAEQVDGSWRITELRSVVEH